MIYVFGGEKGGTGKTTFCTNLAVCLAMRGRSVLLLDADAQRSAFEWAQDRARLPGADALPRVPYAEVRGDVEVASAIRKAKRLYDDVVVDVGGAKTPEFHAAAAVADVLFSPMVPSKCDLRTADALEQLVQELRAKNTRLRASVLLNKCHPSGKRDIARARATLAEKLTVVDVAESNVFFRLPVSRAYEASIAVPEFARDRDRHVRRAAQKAMGEMWSVFEEVTNER